jgi:hypothetical protein
MCIKPPGGHETWSYPADGNHLSVYKTLPPCILVKRLSGRDRYYMVLLGGVRHDIPNMDTLHGLGVSDKDYLEIDEEGACSCFMPIVPIYTVLAYK